MTKGLPLIDLTAANPTHCGRFFPAEVLERAAAQYFAARRYDPDPKGWYTARSAIRRYYAQRSLELDEQQIFITASTSESYRLLFSLLCDPGDNLLAPDVTYPLFDFFAEDRGVGLRNYTLGEQLCWAIDGKSIEAGRDKNTRAVLVVSPHNPTGAVQRARIEQIAQAKLPIVADEVFAEFVHDGGGAPPLGVLYPELPVFHLNGASKMFALPDLKVGWIALNAPAYREYGERLELLNDLFLSASSPSQHILAAAFAEGGAFMHAMTEEVGGNVEYAAARLVASGRFTLNVPQAGSFVFPKLNAEIDEEELVLELLDAGVLVHPGYFYGCTRGAHLMISCLVERAELAAGLDILLSCDIPWRTV